MLRLYRICRNVYDPGDPTGASRTSGRWHILGQRVLYFSSSLALCVLELKANSVSFTAIRQQYHYINVEINSDKFLIEEVPESFYSGKQSPREKNWIMNRQLTQEYGKEWFMSGRSFILKIHSAVLPTDSNFVLNTLHPQFANFRYSKPKPIPLDSRVK